MKTLENTTQANNVAWQQLGARIETNVERIIACLQKSISAQIRTLTPENNVQVNQILMSRFYATL